MQKNEVLAMPDVKEVVGVRFQGAGKIHYHDAAGVEVDIKDLVVVETKHGSRIGRVVIVPSQVIASDLSGPLPRIIRKAEPEDLSQWDEIVNREREVFSKCCELVSKLELPMKVIGAEGRLESNYFIVYFSAPEKVDFRQLARELAAAIKSKVELRQVGARDAAKFLGGIGRCGAGLCCATFLTEFSPVTIKMAKEQNLSLDPMKNSGICGRLLCCLAYESEHYRSIRQKLPSAGRHITTPHGEGKVTSVNPLKETITVQLENRELVEVPLADLGIE